jgi:hypothetical protein
MRAILRGVPRTIAWSRIILLLSVALSLITGCAEQQQKEEAMRQRIVILNESQVMVLTGEIDLPHKQLGEISYSEPLSGAAIDTTHINDRLRRIAIDKYQDSVDAIVHVNTSTDSNGMFNVSGQAVEVEGPCEFCRHKEIIEVANPEDRKVPAPTYQVGDTWTARVDGNDGKIEVLSVSKHHLTLDWLGHKNTYTLDGNPISGNFGIIVGTFDPDLGTLSFPLWKGKRWSQQWMLKTEQMRIAGTTHGQALDWEQIDVPAGSLDALKMNIVYQTELTHMQMTCWYAPEVNALAKCESSNPDFKEEEMVSYRPAVSAASR